MSSATVPDARLKASDHPFLYGLGPGLIAAVEAASAERSYEAGELLLHEGHAADRFYLIFQGKVALEIETPERPRLTLQTVGPGEVLGWSWLLPPHHWQLDARAVKPTRALVVDASALRREFEARPEDGYHFLLRLLPVIAERLENTRVQLLDIHGT